MPDPILVGRNADQRARRSPRRTASRAGPPISTRRSRTRRTRCSSTPPPRSFAPSCCKKAMKAGKHIYCEKPVSETLEGRARSGARGEEGRHQARRGAGQAVPAGPAQAQDADRLRLLRPHPRRCAASSATGCSRATGSRRSGRPGTTRRPRAAASSSTWCATGATCSTTCSATSRA